MENLLRITKALSYIEANLNENIKTEDIAAELFCSKSGLEKLFRYVTNMSIRDYIIRRRMSKAARDIASNVSGASFLDLAVKYGYGSNEAFTRAFKSVWMVTPSEYRNNPRRYELFPPFRLETELMENSAMKNTKKVDISELYDIMCERNDCYFVAIDIVSLVPINEIAIKAGDIAIITAMNRLASACSEEDIVFRVGGDEFVALTNSPDKSYAESIVEEVLSHNKETFDYEGREVPLSLYATTYKPEGRFMRYSDLFSEIQENLRGAKRD